MSVIDEVRRELHWLAGIKVSATAAARRSEADFNKLNFDAEQFSKRWRSLSDKERATLLVEVQRLPKVGSLVAAEHAASMLSERRLGDAPVRRDKQYVYEIRCRLYDALSAFSSGDFAEGRNTLQQARERTFWLLYERQRNRYTGGDHLRPQLRALLEEALTVIDQAIKEAQ